MTNTHLLFKNQCDEHDCKGTDYSHFQGNKGVEENNVRNQYSIPGILHFIQHEWARWVNLKTTLWTKLIFQPEPVFKVWDGAVSVGGREGWAASKDRIPARWTWTLSTTSGTILEHKKYITWTNLGERKGQENLKNDLVRRIKMLEYALKQVFPVDPTN